MSATFQYAQTPLPSDLPAHNYGGSDIAAGLVVAIDSVNVIPTVTEGWGIVLPTVSQSPVPPTFGVTMEVIKAGNNGRVRPVGVVNCTSNGTITAGGAVDMSVDSSKLGWVKAHTSATAQCGLALSSATDGGQILVLLSTAQNA